MAKKDDKKEKKKKKNQGYGKVILILGIILALAIGANFVVPDMVKDVKNGRGPFHTVSKKVSALIDSMKSSDEEEKEEDKDSEGTDEETEETGGEYADLEFLGSWVYTLNGKDVIFTFNADGTGSMAAEGYYADMKYSVDGDVVTMEYYLNGQLDETENNKYEYDEETDTLYLTQYSGEGTRNELKRYTGSSSSAADESSEDGYLDGSEVGTEAGNENAGEGDSEGAGSGLDAGYSVDGADGTNLGEGQTDGTGSDEQVLEGSPDFNGDMSLVGSWAYTGSDGYAVFTFNDDGTGMTIAEGVSADFRWNTDGDLLTMDYYSNGQSAGTEKDVYKVDDSSLSLTYNEGNGGTDTLTKQ